MTRDLSWLRQLPGRPLIVAEIKRFSPYGWVNPLQWQDQLAICEEYGDIISVHTDEMWGGSWEHLREVRALTKKPILAKGFHPTVAHVRRALEIGADNVLTVGWIPLAHTHDYLRSKCWMEAEMLWHIANPIGGPDIRVVCNVRKPRTGEMHTDGMEYAHMARKLSEGWLCQASSIKGPADVVFGMDAILIGQSLYT